MATIGLVSLTERLLSQTAGQAQEPQTATPSRTSANNGAVAATEDQFTPSAQSTALAAGLFTVSQFTLFSPAAQFFLAQTPDPQANPVNAPDTAANFTAPPAAQGAAAKNTAAPVPAPDATTATVAIGTPAPRNTTAGSGASARAAANAPAATSVKTQQQLQLLNRALSALGLNSADIQKIDSIAGLIDDFQPTRFANLAFELQALAQQSAPQAVPQASPQGTSQAPPQAGTNTAGTAAANAPSANAVNPTVTSAGSSAEPGRQ